MSTDITPAGGSPFDAIRQVHLDGTEFWSARDLMPLMGYGAWRNFMVPIERAIATARNQGADVEANFVGSRKVSGDRGPAAEDYELSRYAAYLVAMNGDPNKPEVAAAQHYFAIRTREAETRPVRALPSKRELAQMVIEAEDRADEAERLRVIEHKGREAAESYARELEPKAEYVDKFVSRDDCIQFRDLANQLGTQETALRDQLTEKKWIYRKFIGRHFSKSAGQLVDEFEWRCYADKKQYFRLFSQHNAPRHHNNQLRQTLYVTPPGALAIRKLLGHEAPQSDNTKTALPQHPA